MEKRVYYWSVGGEKFASLQKAKEFVREHAGANCRRVSRYNGSEYIEEASEIYQFSGNDGYKVQILTY